jgi:hypothetical protein
MPKLPEIKCVDDVKTFVNEVNEMLADGAITPTEANAFTKAGTLALQSLKLASEQDSRCGQAEGRSRQAQSTPVIHGARRKAPAHR